MVNHVILQTQTSYEQDVVAKDNELRRVNVMLLYVLKPIDLDLPA